MSFYRFFGSLNSFLASIMRLFNRCRPSLYIRTPPEAAKSQLGGTLIFKNQGEKRSISEAARGQIQPMASLPHLILRPPYVLGRTTAV